MKYVLLLIAMVSVLGACQKKADQDGEDYQMRQATRQIDKGEYDEAINSMQKLRTQTSNPKVIMILASAYAGRAGIKVDNYWGFVIGYEALLPEAQKKQATNPTEAFFQEDATKALSKVVDQKLINDINRNFALLNKVMTRIDKIPYMPREKRVDLQTAVRELQTITTEGAALYKAILEIILLRSAIGDIRDRVSAVVQHGTDPCQGDIEEVLSWIQYSYKLLQTLVADVAVAYPSKKSDLEKVAKVLSDNKKFVDVSSWQAGLSQLKVCE